MKNEYFAQDIVKIMGINQNLLTQWISRGFVKPSQPASGSGTRNIFSFEDICRIELFKELSSAGFARTLASDICFDLSSPPGYKGNNVTSKAISKAMDLCTDKKSKKADPNEPLGVFVLIAQKKGRQTAVCTQMLLSADDFKKIYTEYFRFPEILNSTIAHLVNFKDIVSRILERLKKIES